MTNEQFTKEQFLKAKQIKVWVNYYLDTYSQFCDEEDAICAIWTKINNILKKYRLSSDDDYELVKSLGDIESVMIRIISLCPFIKVSITNITQAMEKEWCDIENKIITERI